MALFVTGCAGKKPADFAHTRPVFDPAAFFTGETSSMGMLQSRGGNPQQIVTTKTVGRWSGDVLLVEQDLTFSGGNTQHRSWQIRRTSPHHFEGRANDVVGTIRGEARGSVFHWSFILKTSPGNPLANVRMSQWMQLQPDGRTMINHTTITKAGLVVAQVTEQFRKEQPR